MLEKLKLELSILTIVVLNFDELKQLIKKKHFTDF